MRTEHGHQHPVNPKFQVANLLRERLDSLVDKIGLRFQHDGFGEQAPGFDDVAPFHQGVGLTAGGKEQIAESRSTGAVPEYS